MTNKYAMTFPAFSFCSASFFFFFCSVWERQRKTSGGVISGLLQRNVVAVGSFAGCTTQVPQPLLCLGSAFPPATSPFLPCLQWEKFGNDSKGKWVARRSEVQLLGDAAGRAGPGVATDLVLVLVLVPVLVLVGARPSWRCSRTGSILCCFMSLM